MFQCACSRDIPIHWGWWRRAGSRVQFSSSVLMSQSTFYLEAGFTHLLIIDSSSIRCTFLVSIRCTFLTGQQKTTKIGTIRL
jgi:hypothetical protein